VAVNKLRTFLSLFGITIGIFCIISVFTVLDWMEKSVRDSISSMGSNVVYVQKFPWSFDSDLKWWDIIKWPTVSMNEYQAVKKRSAKTEYVSFLVAKSDRLKYKNNVANDAVLAAVNRRHGKGGSVRDREGKVFFPL